MEEFFPLIEAMPGTGLIQGAAMVQGLWTTVGSVEDWPPRLRSEQTVRANVPST
ncbi:MAG TPA: hypothetical protein VMA71_03855 [Alloacidobacterium sp.]|nr:hypothetical protein [Alloacidobacterium sp.]